MCSARPSSTVTGYTAPARGSPPKRSTARSKAAASRCSATAPVGSRRSVPTRTATPSHICCCTPRATTPRSSRRPAERRRKGDGNRVARRVHDGASMLRTAPHHRLPAHHSWGHGRLERHVARHDRRLRAVARSYGLGCWDVDDVVQSAWLQYLEHGDALRDPAALGAWLETTARRLCLRLLQRHVREQLTDDCDLRAASEDPGPEREVLAGECRDTVRRALAAL